MVGYDKRFWFCFGNAIGLAVVVCWLPSSIIKTLSHFSTKTSKRIIPLCLFELSYPNLSISKEV